MKIQWRAVSPQGGAKDTFQIDATRAELAELRDDILYLSALRHGPPRQAEEFVNLLDKGLG